MRVQAEAFCRHLPSSGLQAKYVFHDRDAKLGSTFDGTLEANGIEACRNQIRAPNMQAFVERWIQSVQVECLDHFTILGQKHLDYLVSTYVSYYHEHRPHQGLDNELLTEVAEPDDDVPRLKDLRCQQWLGGLLKSYRRKAA